MLYDRKLEIKGTDKDEALSSLTSEVAFTCMEFINETEIILADLNGRFTYLKGIMSEETTTISIISTKINRFRDIKLALNYLISISTEGSICFWDLEKL